MSASNELTNYMELTCNRNLLRWHVGQEIFCRYCNQIMDCKRAVSFDVETPEKSTVVSRCVCAPCYDRVAEILATGIKESKYTLTVRDGRVLFARAKRAPKPKPVSYAVEVIADRSGKWVGNGLRFATRKEAKAYGADLASRWTLVEKWRVVGTQDEVNR
jgi:hypothetical protein